MGRLMWPIFFIANLFSERLIPVGELHFSSLYSSETV
jgi:hypothetical protein